MEISLNEQEILKVRLRFEMERRGIKLQKDFAKLCGITPTYLSFILSGKRIGARRIFQIAKRLKVPPGYLIGREELPRKVPNES